MVGLLVTWEIVPRRGGIAQPLPRREVREPRERFGAAAAYAEQFPKGAVRSPATRLAVVVLLVVSAVIAYGLVRNLWADTSLRVGPVPLIFVLLPVEFLVIVAAIVADHRLPRGFRTAVPVTRD